MDSEFPDRKLGIASFEGSFAPLTRPIVVGVPIPWYKDKKYFTDGWTSLSIWKSAFIEAVATMCLVYISGQISATLSTYNTPKAGAVAGVANIILLSIFIYAASPASGGHLNPMITFSAMCSGLCPIARGVLYLIAQTIGAAVAGGILIGVWGFERASMYRGGGCFLDTDSLTHGQVFLNEIMASFALLYLAYGLGLDPRQAIFFGPRLGPLLVGTSLGLISFATSSIAPGYQGAQMNPARCFAYGVARRDFSAQWIWWFGPAIASILLALVYNAVPPHHSDSSKPKPNEAPVEHVSTV